MAAMGSMGYHPSTVPWCHGAIAKGCHLMCAAYRIRGASAEPKSSSAEIPFIWVNFITTEACSPEAWKSMGFYRGNDPLLWPQFIQVSEI